jgi:DNA-binding transcriptional regulator YdaS (Cro superfamily)
MPRPTVEYLNARRAHKPASGGTNYRTRECAVFAEDVALKKARRPVGLRADDGLYAALKAAGGVRALADLLGINRYAIYNWSKGGVLRVPAEHIIQIEEVIGVPRDVLRPELYEGWEPSVRNKQTKNRGHQGSGPSEITRHGRPEAVE